MQNKQTNVREAHRPATSGLARCSRVVVCSVLFSILISSLGEGRAGLCASRDIICLLSRLKFCHFFFLLFLLVSGVGCDLWHALDFSINFYMISTDEN